MCLLLRSAVSTSNRTFTRTPIASLMWTATPSSKAVLGGGFAQVNGGFHANCDAQRGVPMTGVRRLRPSSKRRPA
jgi:hypothetical protein